MRTPNIFSASLGLSLALALAACNGDDGNGDATATTTATTTMTTTTSTTTETTSMTTDDTTTATTTTTTTTTTTSDTETTTTGGVDPFVFDDADPNTLAQVDRMGMPAINTAVIMSKDVYNQSTPQDDADGTFVQEIVDSLTALHGALDDDLMGAGLTPCMVDDCVAQAAPLVVPDTLTLTLDGTAGFPNGRKLADPVIDVTLAVVLLDLSVHDAGTLAGLPLNPPANDKEFLADFPYAAEPH